MVASHPLGCVYHHTVFGTMISTTFTHAEPWYVALTDAEGRCLGGIALFLIKSWLTGNRFVSVPWACYGDPLVHSVNELNALLEKIKELSKEVRASHVEIRTRDATNLVSSGGSMAPVYGEKAHFLDLSRGIEAVWNGFDKTSVKQRITRAERSGIEVRLATSEEEVTSFYTVFVRHRRQLGLGPLKLEYFQNIWRCMAPLGLAQFWMARAGDECVGGLCCLTFKKMTILSSIAIDESRRRCGIGQSLYWAAIRAAAENGLRIADLGKTSLHSDGLLSYKRAWGGVELETPVFYYPHPMGVSLYPNRQTRSYRAMQWFWRTAPPSLSRVASKFYYRYV